MSKEEDLPVTENEEQKSWELGLLGCRPYIIFCIQFIIITELFRLRSGEHSNITVANVYVSSDFIRFKENVVKTFHGGFPDWKYEPRLVKHVCHALNGKHECCLDEIYKKCTGLVQACSTEVTLFYFKPKSKRFAFNKHPLGIKTLNYILPWPYKEERQEQNRCLYSSCCGRGTN